MFDEAVRQQKLADGRRYAERLAENPDIESVYLCGSLTAGLGNSTSDVDIYVVVHDGERPARPEQSDYDGQRVDIEVRTVRDLRRLAEGLRDAHATTEDNSAVWRLEEHFDDAVRLLSAEFVKAGPETVHTRDLLVQHVDRIRQVLISFRQIRCVNVIEDINGFLDDGLLDGALVTSGAMLNEALEIFLFGCGDLYLGHKWIWHRLERSAGPTFPTEQVRRLAFRAPERPADIVGFVRDRIAFSQVCLTAALVDGWDRPEAGGWRHWTVGADGPRRASDWLPYRFDDGLYLDTFRRRRFRMQPQWLRLWAECGGGRSLAEVVKEHLVDADGDLTEAEVVQRLDKMFEAGTLVAR
ncbi:nucleotidyltransferase domain-containing protein [Micromonospora sp. NPDC023644]|uniref:nucleotidyltransferase domain-containing protein n=1 Tax=Micromonospora sp. NPDC023644 TaxID=3154321 RepID=UPI0033D03F47